MAEIDRGEVEVGMARFASDDIYRQETVLVEGLVVVSGPDQDGDICILSAREAYLPREVAFRLANEILLRLKASAG